MGTHRNAMLTLQVPKNWAGARMIEIGRVKYTVIPGAVLKVEQAHYDKALEAMGLRVVSFDPGDAAA